MSLKFPFQIVKFDHFLCSNKLGPVYGYLMMLFNALIVMYILSSVAAVAKFFAIRKPIHKVNKSLLSIMLRSKNESSLRTKRLMFTFLRAQKRASERASDASRVEQASVQTTDRLTNVSISSNTLSHFHCIICSVNRNLLLINFFIHLYLFLFGSVAGVY